eukprot:1196384-Prorocentrum_minimum.AAC.6
MESPVRCWRHLSDDHWLYDLIYGRHAIARSLQLLRRRHATGKPDRVGNPATLAGFSVQGVLTGLIGS